LTPGPRLPSPLFSFFSRFPSVLAAAAKIMRWEKTVTMTRALLFFSFFPFLFFFFFPNTLFTYRGCWAPRLRMRAQRTGERGLSRSFPHFFPFSPFSLRPPICTGLRIEGMRTTATQRANRVTLFPFPPSPFSLSRPLPPLPSRPCPGTRLVSYA